MRGGIEIVDARVAYGPIEVLHGVTMSFPSGAVVALLGRNGSGKSTLMNALAGLVPLRSGQMRWDGRDITRWTPHARAAAGLTLVPEQRNVFASMTVEENLRLFAGANEWTTAYETFPELESLAEHRAGTLSGGERQMLAVCHALLQPSAVLLFDEVSSGLAPGVVARLSEVIRGLRHADRTIVVVEQYLHEVMRLADFVYVLRRGEVSFAGESSELTPAGTAGAQGE